MGQKIAMAVAWLSYLAALVCVGLTVYYYGQMGGEHPVVASFSATIVFFLGVGIVLHVIGRADIPDLRIRR
jgi:uncharacterized PurR-regulated membrane protein YhhQ (DUF165 family)